MIFRAFKNQITGMILLEKYIKRTDEVRNTVLLRKVLHALRRQTEKARQLDNAFCCILKQRKIKTVNKVIEVWLLKYKKNQKRSQLEKLSKDFLKCRYLNKYMTIWLKKLSLKLKKRHLKQIVLPQAKYTFFISFRFKAWHQLFQKSIYLKNQLASIENH